MDNHVIAVVAWIHLLATVTWLGLIISSALVFLPILGSLDETGKRFAFPTFHKKTVILTSISIIIAVIAGVILTVTNENDLGPSQLFSNPWSTLIVLKHVLIGAMVVLQAWSLFILQPRLIKLLQSNADSNSTLADSPEPAINHLISLNNISTVLSAILGCGVLLIIAVVLTFY